jgi:CheY-like chemotaxis protein
MVREAFDGVDAIEKANKSKPDLILLDLAMPRINGAEAAAVLKNDLPETPVILFTLTELHVPVRSLADSAASMAAVSEWTALDAR